MARAIELNIESWEREISQSSVPTLVYFWHQQCPWCIRLTPIFDEVAEMYAGKIKFAKLNVLESTTNQEIATNLGIMSTPTLMFFCSGRPIGQTVGLVSKEELGKILDDMLGRYRTCIRQSTDLRDYIV